MNLRTRFPVLRRALAAGISAALVAQTALSPVLADTLDAPLPAEPAVSERIAWQGGEWYLNGVNVPWFNWGCDFGCGAKGGVSDPAVNAQLSAGFGQLSASGVRVARWWVFEGDAWQITRDASGAPSGLSPQVLEDMDAALRLAEQHDLYYSFTLFHGPTNVPSSWLTDPEQRRRLVEALTPLFARYKDNPRVLAWDVINEPEWDIWQNKIAREPVQALVKDIATAVHTHSNAKVTVGSAMMDGLPMWVGLGLDYYQAHWYDYMKDGAWCARCTDYETARQKFGLDRPLIIGEFYAGSDTDAAQRLADWRQKGFAGAYAWSYFSDKTHDKMGVNLAAVKAFADQHPDVQMRVAAAPAPVVNG